MPDRGIAAQHDLAVPEQTRWTTAELAGERKVRLNPDRPRDAARRADDEPALALLHQRAVAGKDRFLALHAREDQLVVVAVVDDGQRAAEYLRTRTAKVAIGQQFNRRVAISRRALVSIDVHPALLDAQHGIATQHIRCAAAAVDKPQFALARLHQRAGPGKRGCVLHAFRHVDAEYGAGGDHNARRRRVDAVGRYPRVAVDQKPVADDEAPALHGERSVAREFQRRARDVLGQRNRRVALQLDANRVTVNRRRRPRPVRPGHGGATVLRAPNAVNLADRREALARGRSDQIVRPTRPVAARGAVVGLAPKQLFVPPRKRKPRVPVVSLGGGIVLTHHHHAAMREAIDERVVRLLRGRGDAAVLLQLAVVPARNRLAVDAVGTHAVQPDVARVVMSGQDAAGGELPIHRCQANLGNLNERSRRQFRRGRNAKRKVALVQRLLNRRRQLDVLARIPPNQRPATHW